MTIRVQAWPLWPALLAESYLGTPGAAAGAAPPGHRPLQALLLLEAGQVEHGLDHRGGLEPLGQPGLVQRRVVAQPRRRVSFTLACESKAGESTRRTATNSRERTSRSGTAQALAASLTTALATWATTASTWPAQGRRSPSPG